MDRIKAANTMVLALSVDPPDSSAGFKKAMQLPFELLCDPDRQVVRLYRLLNPHEHDGIAYPAIFVLNRKGRICYRSLDRTASRVQLDEVLTFLDRLADDPALAEAGGLKKTFIIPSLPEMWQIAKNMVFRGSRADWKHYAKFTFVYTPKNSFKILSRTFQGKKENN